MDLYIANCSKADFLFCYMLIGNERPFQQKIRAGAQVKLQHQPEEIEHIIRQHELYGMCHVERIGQGFSNLAYQRDKPISIKAIEAGITQGEQEAIDRALEVRKIGAVATDALLEKTAQEGGLRQVSPIEVSVTEEGKGPSDPGSGFDETIAVEKQGLPESRGRGRRRA